MSRAALLAAVVLWAAPARAVYQCGDTRDDCPCAASNPYPCCSNGGNCTWYAWEAACCSWGRGLPGWGNANQWAGNARANASYEVKAYPVTDAVSCRDLGAYGHVAFTTAVSGSSVTVHEQNCWGNYGMDTATYAASFFSGGYIVRAGQVACRPGDTQTQSCGNCGTQSRGCGTSGAWGGWGACTSQGECAPGATDEQACGDCGRHARTCSASCSWGAFAACQGADPAPAAGACDAGVPGACGQGALRCVGGALQCAQVVQPAAEVCDGVDNDCDGVIDGPSVCAADAGGELPQGPSGEAGEDGGPTKMTAIGGCSASGGAPMLILLLLLRSLSTGSGRGRG